MKIMGLEKCQQMCIEILIQWNEKGDKEIEVVISKIFFFIEITLGRSWKEKI